jgi:predicted ArsR family transcriptional regulator
MFLPGIRDLVKGPWVKLLEELKISGGLPVPELARRLECSYMGAKDQCEALVKLGYVEKWRLPRQEVGRPEIMYRLAAKAASIFPQAGVGLSLGLLESSRVLFGPNAPERLLLQHFTQQQERWLPKLSKCRSLVERATLLTGLREAEGCLCRCKYDPQLGFRIEEYHHPMMEIFAAYPNAATLELRMLEALLGSRIQRREIPGGSGGPARVEFMITTLGVQSS